MPIQSVGCRVYKTIRLLIANAAYFIMNRFWILNKSKNWSATPSYKPDRWWFPESQCRSPAVPVSADPRPFPAAGLSVFKLRGIPGIQLRLVQHIFELLIADDLNVIPRFEDDRFHAEQQTEKGMCDFCRLFCMGIRWNDQCLKFPERITGSHTGLVK